MHNVVTIEPLAAHMGLLATLPQWLEAGRHSIFARTRLAWIERRPVMTDAAIGSFGLDRIGQIAVPVSDIERAIAFYRAPDQNLLALMSEVFK